MRGNNKKLPPWLYCADTHGKFGGNKGPVARIEAPVGRDSQLHKWVMVCSR